MTESFTSSPRTHGWSAGNDCFNNFTIVVGRLGGKMGILALMI